MSAFPGQACTYRASHRSFLPRRARSALDSAYTLTYLTHLLTRDAEKYSTQFRRGATVVSRRFVIDTRTDRAERRLRGNKILVKRLSGRFASINECERWLLWVQIRPLNRERPIPPFFRSRLKVLCKCIGARVCRCIDNDRSTKSSPVGSRSKRQTDVYVYSTLERI